MAVVLLAAFLMIACLLALRFEKQLTAVLPLATCILILILYVLAFFRRLSWIDYFSTAIVVGAVLRVLFLSGEKKKKLFAQLRELFFAPSAIAAMVLLTGAVLLTGNKITTWWDDLNFWATDVKALLTAGWLCSEIYECSFGVWRLPAGNPVAQMVVCSFKAGQLF